MPENPEAANNENAFPLQMPEMTAEALAAHYHDFTGKRVVISNAAKDKVISMIGAGEMTELALKYLKSNNVNDITISNRKEEKGKPERDKGNICTHPHIPSARVSSYDAFTDSLTMAAIG